MLESSVVYDTGPEVLDGEMVELNTLSFLEESIPSSSLSSSGICLDCCRYSEKIRIKV